MYYENLHPFRSKQTTFVFIGHVIRQMYRTSNVKLFPEPNLAHAEAFTNKSSVICNAEHYNDSFLLIANTRMRVFVKSPKLFPNFTVV